CSELSLPSVAVFSEDDSQSLHIRAADEACALTGVGVAAYLNVALIIALAREARCDAIHPGYGFLSESAACARVCKEAGLIFVGPDPHVLDLFGNKTATLELAQRCDIPVPEAITRAVTVDEARELRSVCKVRPLVIKAAVGGGGSGIRVTANLNELEKHYERCRSEARAAFGSDE